MSACTYHKIKSWSILFSLSLSYSIFVCWSIPSILHGWQKSHCIRDVMMWINTWSLCIQDLIFAVDKALGKQKCAFLLAISNLHSKKNQRVIEKMEQLHNAILLPSQVLDADGWRTIHSNRHTFTNKYLFNTTLRSPTFCSTHTAHIFQIPGKVKLLEDLRSECQKGGCCDASCINILHSDHDPVAVVPLPKQ